MSLATTPENGKDPLSAKIHAADMDHVERVRAPHVNVLTTTVVEMKTRQTWAGKFILKCYRVVGLAILVFILAGLLSYLALVGFYSWNSTWISPQIISPIDEHVLPLSYELAQETLLHEKLSSERYELVVRFRDAQRQEQKTSDFSKQFVNTVRLTFGDATDTLKELRGVLASYNSTAPQILNTADQSLPTLESEDDKLYRAHLIDRDEYLSRKRMLSQVKLAGLSLQRDSAQLRELSNALDRAAQSYEQLLKAPTDQQLALSYDVLRAKREYDSAFLEKTRAQDLERALKAEIETIDREIAQQDALLNSIRQSPYLRAAHQDITVAALPYENEVALKVGTPIYGCSLRILWCHRVGRVEEIFSGEIVEKHPFYNKSLRGILIRTSLEDQRWARKPALFLNRAPLVF
jgi:hypothetical protein